MSRIAVTIILAVLMLSASATAVVTLNTSASDVTVNPGDETTSVTVEVTNTGDESGNVTVDFNEGSLPANISIDGVTGNDPTDSGLGAVVSRNGSNNDVTFSSVDEGETVTATTVVNLSSTSDVNASIQANVENLDGGNVLTETADITTEQSLRSEYAGDDGEIEPRELITAIGDFRSGELTPSEIIKVIGIFRGS